MPGIEEVYANALVGTDTVCGGDVGKPGGADHLIADCYPTTEVMLPDVYRDEMAAALRAQGGATPENAELTRRFIEKYDLLHSRERLAAALAPDESPLRRRFMENMGEALDVMVRTALATAEQQPLPSYEERFRAATKRDPELIDVNPLRERLIYALSFAGFEVSRSRNLRETAQAWEAKVGHVPPEDFATRVDAMNRELMKQARRHIFSRTDFSDLGYGEHLEGVPFDGLTLKTVSNVRYSGSSAFEGGLTADGKPAGRSLIEFNTDHPITEPGLAHLCAHEMKPGHYVDGVLSDLGWRAGKLGLEAVAHTMCTPEVALREGWAQNALAMAYGGSEPTIIGVLGEDQRVEYLLQRLQDAGKQNASILHQLRGIPIEDVQKHLAAKCVLSDAFVKKLSGSWARHPIFGPMYGPAYALGYEKVHAAIARHGYHRVVAAALHRHGYLDIETFEMALAA